MPKEKPTIIVTGSSGLLGEAIVRRLSPQYEVVGLDVASPPADSPVDFVKFDITEDDSVEKALEYVQASYGRKIASVIHLAAYYDFAGEPSPLYDEITVQGTKRLLEKLKKYDVEQFIFSSTLLVHEPTEPGEPINEDDPLEPKWDYPQSKVETENLIREEHGDIPMLILRIAGIYDDEGHSIPIANQIKRIYEKDVTGRVYPGDLTHGQAYLHKEDLVDAIESAVDRRARLPEELTLLLGEDKVCSYGEMQNILGKLIHGENWSTVEIPEPLAKIGAWIQDKAPVGDEPFIKPWMVDLADDHYELDLSRAEEYLDWTPQHYLAAVLPKIVESLRRDPLEWYEQNDLDPPANLKEEASPA